MTGRTGRFLWGLALLALLGGLGWLFRTHVLAAPEGAFEWVRQGITYELVDPRPLGVVLVAPLLLFVLGRSLADLPWQQRVMAFVIRLAFLLALGLGLSRLVRTAESHQIATVFVVDVSDSVADEALEDARAAIVRLGAARRGSDVVKLVTFARRPRLVEQIGRASCRERVYHPV